MTASASGRGALMEKSMFAYRVLLALVFGVIAVVVVAAAYVGVLGPTLQSWLQTQAAPIVGLYRAHRDAVQLVILVVRTGVPAVTGSLAIFRGFYYAEQNLPARLQELIETAQIRHLSERPELLAYVRQPFNTNDFLVPGIMANPLSRLLRVIGISTTRYRAKELALGLRSAPVNSTRAPRRSARSKVERLPGISCGQHPSPGLHKTVSQRHPTGERIPTPLSTNTTQFWLLDRTN